MIKFHTKGPQGGLYGFGLSARNVELLKQGKPIVIDMMEVGVPDMQIVLFYGETEEAIADELRQHGLLPASFDVSKPDPGEIRVFRDLGERNPDG
jgi:hypothetical protein